MQTQVQNGLGTVQKSEVKQASWLGLMVQLKTSKKPIFCAKYREGVWCKYPQPFSIMIMEDLKNGVAVLNDRHDEKPPHFLETLNGNHCFEVISVNCIGITDLWFPRYQFKRIAGADSV